jgi:subtilisin family serine protease
MRKILLCILLLQCCTLALHAQTNKMSPTGESVYYYYKGQKLYFNVTYKKIVVGFAEGHSMTEIKNILTAQSKTYADSVKATAVKNQCQVKLDKIANEATGKAIAQFLRNNKIVLYVRGCIVGLNGKLSSYGNDFIVKLKPGTSIAQLNALINANNCRLKSKYMFDNNIFILSAGAANEYDGLKMANKFFETGLFEYAEPDLEMYNAIDLAPPNDPLYNLQWDHKNTGSAEQYNGIPGADMNVDSAWLVTKGTSTISIAVIDEGVDINHPDLKKNMMQGFDATTLTSGTGAGQPLNSANAHGTCCAGIIAALSNNNIGIAGIAPKCKIMPVNVADANGYFTTDANIAAGIDYAWMHGADVLSNSWGGGAPSSAIDDAIHRAVTQGRNGKGCTIFFSAGNNNSGLSYPAINDEVVAVGGINMCNKRKDPTSCDGENWWGASYGAGLDVVAPCVKIVTTDISGTGGYSADDYDLTFNGTSSACPHAAAVAALVLSVNSSLKQDKVITIIENSANKIPDYTFKYTPGYNNGTWNNEVGYGRVDAYHAVLAAQSGIYCNAEITALGTTRFCTGDSVTLQVVNKKSSAKYQWYRDDALIKPNAGRITAKKSGSYYVIAKFTNGCNATSAPVKVTAVKSQKPLIADAGKDVTLCPGSSGVRIGGLPGASGGTAFLSEKRAYSMDWYTNNLYRYNLNDPSQIDVVASNMVSPSDLNSGAFFAGGDFTPFGYYGLTRLTNRLIRIDTLSGYQQLINTITPNTGEWSGLAWDAKGEQLYAISSFGAQSELYKIDLVTGNADFVATIPAYYLIWIAIDNNGKMYALSLNDRYIYSINKQTGAATALPNVSDAGFNYAQDADVDPVSNKLYLSAFTARQNYVGDLRIANTTTGTVNSVGTIGLTPFNEMDATAIAGNSYQYKWSPASGLSDVYDANPFANPSTNTTYTLTVTDLCGKQSTAKIKVIVNGAKPAVKITASTHTICDGSIVKLKATSNDNYIYQWYLNNKKINGATDSFYNAKKTGSYKVWVSYGLGGCDSMSKVFSLKKCTDKEFEFASNDDASVSSLPAYSLFPNPAKNIVTLTLPASASSSVITVFDMNGKLVMRKNLNGNSTSEQINISGFAAGMYRVVWQQKEKQYSWKLLKQ